MPSYQKPAVNALQERIVNWSLKNFGDQKGINHFAPLCGLVEELGELAEELESFSWHFDKIEDAVGDAAIYLLDTTGRIDIAASTFWPETRKDRHIFTKSPAQLLIHAARLNQAFLKQNQKIRLFSNPSYARKQIQARAKNLVDCLYNFGEVYPIALETFTNIVEKRDWTKNKEQGNAEEEKEVLNQGKA